MGYLLDVTPSKLGQADACIASTFPEGRIAERSRWAARGTVLHEVAERASSAGWSAALEALPAHLDADTRRLAEEFDLEALQKELGGGSYSWGVGVMWCVQTGEGLILGTGLTRERAHEIARREVEQREGDWLVGLLDLAGQVVRDGVLWVLVPDLKTGHERPERAASCWQTRAYAVMLASALGAGAAMHGPLWMPDGKRPKWDEPETLDAGGLFEAEDELRALLLEVERVRGLPMAERPAPTYGDHCDYCPRTTVCAAITNAVRRFDDGLAVDDEGQYIITAENAQAVYRRMQAVQKALDLAKKGLQRYASVHGAFPVGKGRLFGPYNDTERKIQAGVVYPTLVRLGVPSEQAQEMTLKVTKQSVPITGLVAAYVEHKHPDPVDRHGKGAKLERELMEALEEADGIRVVTTPGIGVHWPKQTLLTTVERDGQESTKEVQ